MGQVDLERNAWAKDISTDKYNTLAPWYSFRCNSEMISLPWVWQETEQLKLEPQESTTSGYAGVYPCATDTKTESLHVNKCNGN